MIIAPINDITVTKLIKKVRDFRTDISRSGCFPGRN